MNSLWRWLNEPVIQPRFYYYGYWVLLVFAVVMTLALWATIIW